VLKPTPSEARMLDCSPPRRLRHSWEARCRLVQLVNAGVAPSVAAERCGVSRATAYRLVARYRAGGWAALRDRSSAPHHCPKRLSAAAEEEILELRRSTGWGPRTIATALGRPHATVWRVLVRHGVNRHAAQPRPPANRYEYDQAGALIHLDTKKLGRFWRIGKRILNDGVQRNLKAGWQHAHVAIDDHSRVVVCELYPREDAASCVRFLDLVVAHFAERGITIQRVMTDNGSGYRSHDFKAALARHQIRHLRTKPYTPRTNGKAEAFIRILQREWAYAFAYRSSADRARALPGYIRWYNTHRPHGSLNGQPPLSRLGVSQPARLYS
jgi:transposase InsO family protein